MAPTTTTTNFRNRVVILINRRLLLRVLLLLLRLQVESYTVVLHYWRVWASEWEMTLCCTAARKLLLRYVFFIFLNRFFLLPHVPSCASSFSLFFSFMFGLFLTTRRAWKWIGGVCDAMAARQRQNRFSSSSSRAHQPNGQRLTICSSKEKRVNVRWHIVRVVRENTRNPSREQLNNPPLCAVLCKCNRFDFLFSFSFSWSAI